MKPPRKNPHGQHIRKWGYGYASELPRDDKRHPKYKKQRAERGFDGTELWNLDTTFAKFMAPRLRAFAEEMVCHPNGTTETEWAETIEKIALGLDLMVTDDYFLMTKQQQRQVDTALKLFAQNIRGMWN